MKGASQKQIKSSHPGSRKRGGALLVVLSVLTILSVLILAFVSSMITESTSSNAVEMSYRTKMVARGALSHSIELLRSNIPDPTPITKSPATAPRQNWATNPGRLTLISGSGSRVHIPLHSGEAPDPEEDVVFDARSTDINRPLPGRARAPIAGGDEDAPRPEMRVAWIPVLEDPSLDAGPENRMTARYAFWIDDETSKLNTSVTLGKSKPEELKKGAPDNWKEQLDNGWVTPVFSIKNDKQKADPGSSGIRVSLGHPWSVNFDTLFDDDEMPIDLTRLHNESHVHGFQRYPDAILRFIDLEYEDKRKWYDKNLWNITFYNRSPEFNAFGFSRLFTLNAPTALTTGPAYQTPFTQNGNDHFQALYGFPVGGGFLLVESEHQKQLSKLTLASGKTLMQYLKQKWPGQSQSFVGKYGSEEAKQMVLNMLMMSRFATGTSQGGLTLSNSGGYHGSSVGNYSGFVSSMNYVDENEAETGTPERFYWHLNDRFEIDPGQPPMLPQSPGPHLNEIKFVVVPVETIIEGKRFFRLRYHYEAEYYLHPESPFAAGKTGDANAPGTNGSREFSSFGSFPVKVDYLKLEVGDHAQTFDQADWDSENLNKLAAKSLSAGGQNAEPSRYHVVRSPSYLLTEDEHEIGKKASVLFDPFKNSKVKFKVNLRLGLASSGGASVKQMVPLGTEPEDTLEGELSIDLSFPDPEYFVSWEVEDPRVSWHKDDWNKREGEDSMGEVNSNQPENPEASEYNSFKYVRLQAAGTIKKNGKNLSNVSSYGNEFQSSTRFPSVGYLSMLHTGIRNRNPWSTLSLETKGSGFQDWVLMDLLGATFPLKRGEGIASRSLPDHWMGLSYMNATAGKVNLNNKIYPDNAYFKAPKRTKPLKAVFRYLRDDHEIDSLVENILDWQDGGKSFEYVGQLSEVSGYAKGDSTWEKEMLLRNMANCLTTQSNTFGVWGVAQTVKKSRDSILHDKFEVTDFVTGEKRFYALVERYIWPGRDGVPGNGHINDKGEWDRLAKLPEDTENTGNSNSPAIQTTQPGDLPQLNAEAEFALIDGPESVDLQHSELLAKLPYESTSLAKADNPADAVVKYRVIYFKFLDH